MIRKINHILLLAPLWGVVLFISLYLLAVALYPGGSGANIYATSFSVTHNYWCDLLDSIAYNGIPNPSRPIAFAAMLVLNCSLVAYWYFLPGIFPVRNQPSHLVIRGAGIISMVACIFVFTSYHDVVIEISAFFGSVALILAIIEMYKAGQKRLFNIGIFSFIWCLASLFIFTTNIGLSLLPLTQKIAFLIFFIWVGLSSIVIYRRSFYY